MSIIDRWQGKKVLILGDAMLDRWYYGTADRTSPEANCKVFTATRKEEYPGGAANVRANVMSLGGIATLLAPRDRSVKTRFVTSAGHLLRFDEDTSADDVPPTTVETLLGGFAGAIRFNDIVVLSDYAKGALRDEVLLPAIRIARDAGKTIIVDPKRSDWSGYAGANFITPNSEELDRVEMSGMAWSTLNYDVIEKRGADGAVVRRPPHHSYPVPTRVVRVSDVTGAGDTFVAAFALGIAAGVDVFVATQLANVAASIAVSKPATATVNVSELRAAL